MNNIAVATSIFANSLIPGSLRYEMLSSRAYRMRHTRRWYAVMWMLDSWFELVFDEIDHCEICYETQSRELAEVWK